MPCAGAVDDRPGCPGPVGRDERGPREVTWECSSSEHEGAVLGPAHAQVETLVGLLVDEVVADPAVAESMAPQLVRPVGRVGAGVEDGLVVVGPRHAVGGSFDRLVQVCPRLEVAHLQGEALVAGGVDGVGEPVVSGAHGEVGDSRDTRAPRPGRSRPAGPARPGPLVPEFANRHRRRSAVPGGNGRVPAVALDRQAAMDGVVAALDGAV